MTNKDRDEWGSIERRYKARYRSSNHHLNGFILLCVMIGLETANIIRTDEKGRPLCTLANRMHKRGWSCGATCSLSTTYFKTPLTSPSCPARCRLYVQLLLVRSKKSLLKNISLVVTLHGH
jgi:hypothetical protein